MNLHVFIFFAVLFLQGANVTGLVCLSCEGITQPRHCHQVEECLDDQYCAVESYLDRFHDNVYYNLRCKNKELCPGHSNSTGSHPTAYCTECCQNDLCNANGCGSPDLPTDIGPICYTCKSLVKGLKCHQIEICDKNEVCYVDETEEFGDILIDNGCRTAQTCHVTNGMHPGPSTIVGKRSISERSLSHSMCTNCCDLSLCNHDCSFTEYVSGRDCLDIHTQRPQAPSGPYQITIGQNKSLMVWCDMTTAGGGWTVFQKRFDGSVDFYRTFAEYQKGFGNVTGEFWLGLENTYELTVGHNNTLRVEITAYNGSHMHEEMGFNLGPGPQYVLHLTSPSYEMSAFDGHPFTTKDVERDLYSSGNCAVMFHGGFWYNSCINSANPNGRYNPGGTGHEMSYYNSQGNRAMEMKFRRNT